MIANLNASSEDNGSNELSSSRLCESSVWNEPFLDFNYNLGSFETFRWSNLTDDDSSGTSNNTLTSSIGSKANETTLALTATTEYFMMGSSLSQESGRYFGSCDETSEVKGSKIRLFEEFLVKGLPKDFRRGRNSREPYPVKNKKRHRSSFLIYALGQFVIFILLILKFDFLGLFNAQSWLLVLGISNLLFSLAIVGYALINVFGYLAVRKNLQGIEMRYVNVWKIKPTHNHARFALWINTCWVFFSLIIMILNFIVLMIERLLGNPPLPIDLLIVYIIITVIYALYAIFHRKLAYCCWYNWYRRYDENNNFGTWGYDNNGNIKNSIMLQKLLKPTSSREDQHRI